MSMFFLVSLFVASVSMNVTGISRWHLLTVSLMDEKWGVHDCFFLSSPSNVTIVSSCRHRVMFSFQSSNSFLRKLKNGERSTVLVSLWWMEFSLCIGFERGYYMRILCSMGSDGNGGFYYGCVYLGMMLAPDMRGLSGEWIARRRC
jgi:hypothetical protein